MNNVLQNTKQVEGIQTNFGIVVKRHKNKGMTKDYLWDLSLWSDRNRLYLHSFQRPEEFYHIEDKNYFILIFRSKNDLETE